ncbi:MAG: 4-(cytidine 5'-diphospho)-2-C-methyl-D-erythritol kinase [Rhodoluna sp.]
MTDSIRVSTPAKINLLFGVGALQPDGYHEVASLYHAVDLLDELKIKSSSSWSIELSGNISQAQKDAVPSGEDNLVVRAAKQVAKMSGIESPHPVSFEITKNIPVAGGLAGGSADAAAALIAVNELWCTGLSGEQLHTAAVALGSDVPFSLIGGTAIGKGRGENLEPIEGVKKFNWVLAFSEIGLSTPLVYRRLDEIRTSRGEDITAARNLDVPQKLIDALRSGDARALAAELRNDLQEAAIDLRNELSEVIQTGKSAGALVGFISGSGPTVAFLTDSAESSQGVCEALKAVGIEAVAVSGPVVGPAGIQALGN